MYDYTYEELMNLDDDYYLPVEEVNLPIHNPSDLKDGDIIITTMYYNDGTNRRKTRPSVVLEFPDKVLRVVRLSEVKSEEEGRSREIIDDPLTYTLLDWNTESENLRHESYFLPWYYREIDRIDYHHTIGRLTVKDLDACKENLNKCIDLKDSNLKYLLGWLKGHDIKESRHISGNNNYNPIQSIRDIEISLKGNCVDFANIAHLTADKEGLVNTIGRTMFWLSPNKSTGHVYCVYKQNRAYRIFRFIPGDNDHDSFGDIIHIKRFKAKTFIDACSTEEYWLSINHPEIKGLPSYEYIAKTRYLSKEDLKTWDKLAKTNMTQSEVLKKTFDKK